MYYIHQIITTKVSNDNYLCCFLQRNRLTEAINKSLSETPAQNTKVQTIPNMSICVHITNIRGVLIMYRNVAHINKISGGVVEKGNLRTDNRSR